VGPSRRASNHNCNNYSSFTLRPSPIKTPTTRIWPDIDKRGTSILRWFLRYKQIKMHPTIHSSSIRSWRRKLWPEIRRKSCQCGLPFSNNTNDVETFPWIFNCMMYLFRVIFIPLHRYPVWRSGKKSVRAREAHRSIRSRSHKLEMQSVIGGANAKMSYLYSNTRYM